MDASTSAPASMAPLQRTVAAEHLRLRRSQRQASRPPAKPARFGVPIARTLGNCLRRSARNRPSNGRAGDRPGGRWTAGRRCRRRPVPALAGPHATMMFGDMGARVLKGRDAGDRRRVPPLGPAVRRP
jgi:hypothetical protein